MLLISEHFAPSTGATAQLMTDLARGLARRGWAITVLTATPGAAMPFAVVRLGGAIEGSSTKSVVQKALRGVRFLLGSLLWSLQHGRRGDVVAADHASGPVGIETLGRLHRLAPAG